MERDLVDGFLAICFYQLLYRALFGVWEGRIANGFNACAAQEAMDQTD